MSYKVWRQRCTKVIHADLARHTRNEDGGYVPRQTSPNAEQSAQSDMMSGTLQGPSRHYVGGQLPGNGRARSSAWRW